jgi:hypothetical protein
MKKFLNLLLIVLLGLSLTSCGDKDNEAADVTIAPPPAGGGGNGNGSGNGLGLGSGGNIDPWNRVDVDMSAVVNWQYRDQFNRHTQATNSFVRPFVNRDRVRTVDMNDSRWTPVSQNDFMIAIQDTRQLPAERGLVVKQQRIYFKKMSGFGRGEIRCAALKNSTMTIVDVYSGTMVTNNSNMNEVNIDGRRECSGLYSTMPFNGAYQGNLNDYYDSFNVNTIVSQLNSLQVERLERRNNQNRFFKVKGIKYDNEFQQNLQYEYLFMAARGQYRVLLVKKYNYAGKLVDSAYNQFSFEHNQGNLYYNSSNVRTWNSGYNFFITF